MGFQRVRHDWAAEHIHAHTCTHNSTQNRHGQSCALIDLVGVSGTKYILEGQVARRLLREQEMKGSTLDQWQ